MASSSARPLQLDQWANTKAPLTSSQRASVNRLAEWLHRNSSESKQQQQRQPPSSSLPPADTSNGDPAVEVNTDNAATASSTDLANGKNSDPVTLPDPSVPLVSAQSFLAWYTQLSDSVTSSTHTSHRQALQRISDTTSTADRLLAQLEACQVNVSELRAGTAFVQDSSRGIRKQAQTLLDSQTHLDTLAEDVASRLSFFTLLPYATNMLSSPDPTIVYSQSFLDLMDQLDMALLFLQQEPAKSYRDASLYRMRYSQCVTRAATLAKMAVVRDLKAEAERISDRIKQLDPIRNPADAKATATALQSGSKGKAREVSDDAATGRDAPAIDDAAADALFGDAAHQIAKLRPLIFELQKRASNAVATSTPSASTAAEFESLLQECKSAWFQYRRPLLSRILLQRISDIETQASSMRPGHGAIVQLSRSGTQLARFVLHREHNLYQQFFGSDTSDANPSDPDSKHSSEPDAALGAYLSELAETFTSRLRPRLAKEEDLAVLAQTASAIADIVHASAAQSKVNQVPVWTRSLVSVLNEAQSRLLARAQVIVTNDIANFVASEQAGHFEFPERIRTYKAASLGTGADQLSAATAATTASAAGAAKAQHRRAKSGAGLLDAALAASHAPSSSKAQQEKVQLFTLPPALLSTYYVPVGYTLELLYHLQALVPATAFRRIAIAAVDACLASVGRGASELVKRKTSDSLERDDAWLFELRQLEILREVVVSAELVLKQARDQQALVDATATSRVESEAVRVGAGTTASLVNLSSLVTAINSLWTNTGRLLYPSTFTAGADTTSPPSAQLDMEPSSSHVSSRLQALVEQIAHLWSDSIVLPLRVYIDQSAAEASAAKFTSTYQALETCIESIIPEKADKVMLWIEDQEVQRLIVGGVCERVVQVYAKFYDLKPADAGAAESVSGLTSRVQGEWSKALSL